MAWYEILIVIVCSSGLSGTVIGLVFRRFEKRIDLREEKELKEQEEHEQARKQHEILMIRSTSAAIALGEATARAVQRIPDAHCNGDMHAALAYAIHKSNTNKRSSSPVRVWMPYMIKKG